VHCLQTHPKLFLINAAKEFARRLKKVRALPANVPKTFLDKLENVEKHLS